MDFVGLFVCLLTAPAAVVGIGWARARVCRVAVRRWRFLAAVAVTA